MTKWYAVQANREDTDWGYGSYDLDEAKEMLKAYPEVLIAVIEEGDDPICIEEIPYSDIYDEEEEDMKQIEDMTDTELMQWIDDQAEFDGESMTELVRRADRYNPDAGILDRWNGEADDNYDIQCYYDEACAIIRMYHSGVEVGTIYSDPTGIYRVDAIKGNGVTVTLIAGDELNIGKTYEGVREEEVAHFVENPFAEDFNEMDYQ